MTDNEIIKALECFAIDKDFDGSQCIGCAFEHQFCTANMSEDIAIPSLDLINRQKAEKEALIAGQETLQKYIAEQKAEIERLNKQLVFEIESAYDRGTKTATKEFAERAKKDGIVRVVGGKYKIVIPADSIDNLAKEMVGEDNNSPIVDNRNQIW